MTINRPFVSAIGADETKDICVVDENSVKQTKLTESPKNALASVLIKDKDFVVYSFEIGKETRLEELPEAVEIKMITDAGLDPSVLYKISYDYTNFHQDQSKIFVVAYAITHSSIIANASFIKSYFGYVDLILSTATLPYALYNNNTLEKKRDIFVYFEKTALILSIFSQGKIVYAKQLDFGLKKIADSYVLISGEQLKYEEIIEILITKGLDASRYTQEEKRHRVDLKEIFANMSSQINSIISYAARMNGFDGYDRLFVTTENGTIPSLANLSEELLGIKGLDYNFFTNFYKIGDPFIEQRLILLALELENIKNKLEINPFNSSIFKRPDSFLKRKGGRFFLAILASILIALSPPMFLLFQDTYNGYLLEKKLNELTISKNELENFRAQEQALALERNALTAELKMITTSYNAKKGVLENIYATKDNRKIVIKFINDVFAEVNANGLKIDELKIVFPQAQIVVVSPLQNKVTALIQKMVLGGYQTQTRSIFYDEKTKKFTSTISVVLK